jgi:hypothetical protein
MAGATASLYRGPVPRLGGTLGCPHRQVVHTGVPIVENVREKNLIGKRKKWLQKGGESGATITAICGEPWVYGRRWLLALNSAQGRAPFSNDLRKDRLGYSPNYA